MSCDDRVRVRRLSQVDDGRWRMITILSSDVPRQQQLAQLQDQPQPPMKLESGRLAPLGCVVDGTTRRSAGWSSARRARRLSRLTSPRPV